MRIAITGRPGIGKTTACKRIYSFLKDSLKIKGFITEEIRKEGTRVGFMIKELHTNFSSILAKKEEGFPRVGKYRVILESLETISERINGYMDADLIIIDEIGPMELKSKSFINSISKLIDSKEDLIFTVHYKSSHPLAERIRREFELITLNEKNRKEIVKDLVMKIDR